MGAFNGKDGEFILKNAVENVRIELLAGNISKQKAYALAKRAAIQNQNPKKIKKFSPFLTPYFTITYDFSSCSS